MTANDVRAMAGVLDTQRNVSKGFVTTTSEFAPRIAEEPGLTALMPHRLELRPRQILLPWLYSIEQRKIP